jgi:DNA-binding transcriptional LysR family regulator
VTGRERWAALEVRHLAAFVAVVEEGSFTGAAARLGYTQSGVSQQIAALERLVERPLLVRHAGGRRPVEPTAAGEALLAHGRALLTRVDRAFGDVSAAVDGSGDTVAVAAFQSAAVHLLPRLRRELLGRVGLRLELIESPTDEVLLRRLAAGEAELAVIALPVPAGLAAHELGSDRYVAVVPAASPLAGRRVVAPSALAGQPLLGIRGCAHEELVETALRAAGALTGSVERYDDNRLVQSLVAEGECVAVVPALTVDARDDEVCLLELDPAPPARRLALAHLADRPLSPAAATVLEAALPLCRRLLAESAAAAVS